MNNKPVLNISTDEFTERINYRIELANIFLKTLVKNERELNDFTNSYSNWNRYNSEYLKIIFDNSDNEYKIRYDAAQPISLLLPFTIGGKYQTIKSKFNCKLNVLQELLYIAELIPTQSSPSTLPIMNSSSPDTTKVFIVHGHNNLIKEQVARTIEKLGLEAIILHEQASGGRTIIEKIEYYSNVQFAIILLTADDLGKAKNDIDLKSRARQNVILELGYFMALLGRRKIMPLHEQGVELPNDVDGVVYVPLDSGEAWKYKLVQELKHAGYNVDSNKLY